MPRNPRAQWHISMLEHAFDDPGLFELPLDSRVQGSPVSD